MMRIFLILIFFCTSLYAQAAEQPYVFSDPKQELRFYELTDKLRCVVCQNQTLLDSDAILARDLRGQVYAMVREGQSDETIIAYLTARYGDFILYQPPLRSDTWLLWFGPLLLLFIFAGVLIVIIRKAHQTHRDQK